MLKAVAVAILVLLATASVSMAKPYPPGSCSLLDDGVAVPAPLVGSFQADPHVILMDMPNTDTEPRGGFIVDILFLVKTDGTVDSPRVLCSKPVESAFASLLVLTAPTWRFTPMKRDGKPIDSEATFRIVFNDSLSIVHRIPLVFMPED